MIKRVKIIGAGSIGNHLAHASRRLGWDVVVCDISPDALERMQKSIYPQRYGQWDAAIALSLLDEAPAGGFDLICIGTPPEHHIPLTVAAAAEAPRAIQVEKPLCPPALADADETFRRLESDGVRGFVGYDHVVGKAARRLVEMLGEGEIGEVVTFDVEFREHWRGIFNAHPWLDGPQSSYLGYWRRGGGASGEHSHAANFWQFLAHSTGHGRVTEVSASLRYVRDGRVDYDDCCFLDLRTETGMIGRVVQDVVTEPVRKSAFIQGTKGQLTWVNGYNAKGDAVILDRVGRDSLVQELPKTRPDDFIDELAHIDASLESGSGSPLDLVRGLETMLVVAAAHRSADERRAIRLDYAAGYSPAALQ